MNHRLIQLLGKGLAKPIALLVCLTTVVCVQASPPNLIIILTDDQGYHDVGFNGSKDIPTPNIDSIASNGVRFTSGYASAALSSASRAGLLTGRYPERFEYDAEASWRPNDVKAGLPLNQVTLAEVLSRSGYHCGIIGKWDLGVHPDLNPLKRGFHESYGFLGPGAFYLPQQLTNEAANKIKADYEAYHLCILRNNQPVKINNYLTDEFSDEAVRFIDKSKAKPFLLYLAYNAPHTPLEATDKYLSRFPDLQSPGRKTYAAMLSAVDDGVGRVLHELRKEGLEERTLVVFLSDTGGSLGKNSSDNYPLRGAKDSPWEGGWRVPFAMQWPGHLPKGMVYNQPVISLDIFATITALAEAPVSSAQPLDGVNLVPYLTGIKPGVPHDALYLSLPRRGVFAVRSGDYKLVIPGPGQPAELFNVNTDVAESKNLAGSEPEVLADLEQKGMAWRRQLVDPVLPGLVRPKATKDQRPIRGD